MATLKEISRVWNRRFIEVARERGLRTVGGYAYVYVDGYVASVGGYVAQATDPYTVSWSASIKPAELDDILWAAFMPDLQLSPAKRRSLRVNGAFTSPALDLERGKVTAPLGEDPGLTLAVMFDRFDDLVTEYLQVAPAPSDFLAQLDARIPEDEAVRPQARLRYVLALIANGRREEAAELLRVEMAKDKFGPMISSQGRSVFDHLAESLE